MSTRARKKEQAKDTGLAMLLILLIVAQVQIGHPLILAAIGVLIVTMTVPVLFTPLARLWFGLAHVMGALVSKLLLSLVFFLVATPIGLLRRLSGTDSMLMKQWRRDKESCFITRDHTFVKQDLEQPY